MQKTKSKTKTLLIITVIFAIAVITVLSLLFFRSMRLSRAIKNMDINEKQSVTRVIKYAKNDAEVLYSIAEQYIANGEPLGAGILLHILQNINCENESAKALLKEYYKNAGADPMFISQVDSAQLIDVDFETAAEYEGACYGGIDGIYCSDFNGLIRFKISSARPKSLFAYKDGVYFLDSTDNCVKTLSYDGAAVKTVLTNTREFIFSGGFIYSIDNSGKIHAPFEPTLNDGELGANLRIEGDSVVCDIYNQSYELLKTITLD